MERDNKYEEMTFREQYISLLRIPRAVEARLDQWKALEQRGIYPCKDIIDEVKDPKVIQWMLEKGFPEPASREEPCMIFSFDLDIEEIIKTWSLDNPYLLRCQVGSGRLNLIKAAADQFGVAAVKDYAESIKNTIINRVQDLLTTQLTMANGTLFFGW